MTSGPAIGEARAAGPSSPIPIGGPVKPTRHPAHQALRLRLARSLVRERTPSARHLRALEHLLLALFTRPISGRGRVLKPQDEIDVVLAEISLNGTTPATATNVERYVTLAEDALTTRSRAELDQLQAVQKARALKYELGAKYLDREVVKAAVQCLLAIERLQQTPGFAGPGIDNSGWRMPLEPPPAPQVSSAGSPFATARPPFRAESPFDPAETPFDAESPFGPARPPLEAAASPFDPVDVPFEGDEASRAMPAASPDREIPEALEQTLWPVRGRPVGPPVNHASTDTATAGPTTRPLERAASARTGELPAGAPQGRRAGALQTGEREAILRTGSRPAAPRVDERSAPPRGGERSTAVRPQDRARRATAAPLEQPRTGRLWKVVTALNLLVMAVFLGRLLLEPPLPPVSDAARYQAYELTGAIARLPLVSARRVDDVLILTAKDEWARMPPRSRKHLLRHLEKHLLGSASIARLVVLDRAGRPLATLNGEGRKAPRE